MAVCHVVGSILTSVYVYASRVWWLVYACGTNSFTCILRQLIASYGKTWRHTVQRGEYGTERKPARCFYSQVVRGD